MNIQHVPTHEVALPESLARAVVADDSIILLSLDAHGATLWANESAKRRWGLGGEAKSFASYLEPEARLRYEVALGQLRHAPLAEPFEADVVDLDGRSERIRLTLHAGPQGAVHLLGVPANGASLPVVLTEANTSSQSTPARIQSLYALTQNVARATGVEAITAAALDGLQAILGSDAAVFLLRRSDGKWSLGAAQGIRVAEPLDLPDPWQERGTDAAPLHISDLSNGGPPGLVRPAGMRSLLALPLTNEGGLLGYAAAYYRSPREFSRAELELAQTAAATVAFAIARHRAIEAAQAKQAELQGFLETSVVALHAIDPEGTILWANQAELRMLGYAAEEYIGHNIREFHVDAEVVREKLARLSRGESLHGYASVLRCRDGSLRQVLIDAESHHEGGRFVQARCFTLDVTERRRAEAELERYKTQLEERIEERTKELREVNKELEAFSYSVSHDLRAPLRAIDGFTQLLHEETRDTLSPRGQELMKGILQGVEFMDRLVNGLLNLSRLTRSEVRAETVDLSTLTRSIGERLRMESPERRVELVVEPGLTVRADPHLMRVLMENLLSNAWKFTSKHPQARIEVGSRATSGGRVFYVRDDGAGFDPTGVPKLFKPFHRLHGRTEFEGTGIGLATVQRIVARHGGRVWAEGAVERGATVSFTIDETPGALAQAPTPEA